MKSVSSGYSTKEHASIIEKITKTYVGHRYIFTKHVHKTCTQNMHTKHAHKTCAHNMRTSTSILLCAVVDIKVAVNTV